MASNSYRIGKYNFEVDFEWVSLGLSENDGFKKILSERGHSCFVKISGESEVAGSQIGTKKKSGYSGKSYSLAGYVEALVDSDRYIFVRELGDGTYYFLLVDNGYIQKDSDSIIAETSLIQSKIAEAASKSMDIFIDSTNADYLTAGEQKTDLSIDEHLTEDKPENDCLVRTTSDTRNQVLKLVVLSLFAVSLVSALYFGYGIIKKQWEESKRESQPIKTRQQLEMEKKAEAEKKVAQRLLLRTKGLAPEAQVRGCIDSYNYQNGLINIGGWTLESMECSARGLVTKISQNTLFDMTPLQLKQRFEDITGVKITFGNGSDQWLKSAQITNNLGIMGMPRREGILPDELPTRGEIEQKIRAKLFDLKRKGFAIDGISEKPEIFSEEDNIPPELLYTVGTIKFYTSNMHQAMVVAGVLTDRFVTFNKIDVFSSNKPQVNGSEDSSLTHTVIINYFYR